MGFENVRDRHAGRRLDLGIRVKERQAQPRREAPADRGFAGSHHADEHNESRSQRGQNFGLAGCADVRR